MHDNDCTPSPTRQPSHHSTTQLSHMKTNDFLEPSKRLEHKACMPTGSPSPQQEKVIDSPASPCP